MCQHQSELNQLNVEVLLVSFCAPEVAKVWLEEICPSFRLLLDPERVTYRTYGGEHSWLRSWNLKTLWRYLQLLSAGRKWRGIQGDSAQLGDFIEDQNAIPPVDAASKQLLKEQVCDVLSTLTQCEQRVLGLRFGLEDGRSRTLEEVGKEFKVTRERIRQIEAKALRKLRHPSRSRKLKDYLE